jgi:hypothetical protein
MKERKNITEIDFTDQIKQSQADEEAGYPPKCNEGYEEKDGKCVKKEVEASDPETHECDNESCGDCGCGEATEESDAELSKENGDKKEDAKAEHYDELEGYDMKCPTCGCALGKMYMKGGMMRPVNMYASKYSDLYEKVKAADPQRDPDKHKVDIKTDHESKRKIEDMPTAEELREVDEPIG